MAPTSLIAAWRELRRSEKVGLYGYRSQSEIMLARQSVPLGRLDGPLAPLEAPHATSLVSRMDPVLELSMSMSDDDGADSVDSITRTNQQDDATHVALLDDAGDDRQPTSGANANANANAADIKIFVASWNMAAKDPFSASKGDPKSVIVLDWRKYTDYSYFEQPSRDYIPQMYAKQLQIDPSNNNSETMRPTSANDAVMLDNSTSLPKCLDELFKRETIEQDDMWMCERCGEQRTGTRQADVWKLPDLVMVQLKRFQYHESGYREKIRTMVDCPLNGLDFSPWVGNAPGAHPDACLYDLYAVVNHVGGLARGHYTAYCRYDSDFEESSRMFTSLDRDRERSSAEMPFTDMWLRFDDEKVVEIAPGDVISDAAYVLFYKRRKMSSRNLLAYSF
ncbi:hypothetical protein ATCC90586_000256 [Pythium insidiosum]|nr:hypothetical protein ATCC90586_000256 [Pythium insidiosum]